MSTWGEDNFDSDFACDYLTEIVYKIVTSIKDCLDKPGDTPITCGEAILMPGVDILVTLVKAYPNVVVPLIEDEPIANWEKRYLTIFDAQDESLDTDFRAKRRAVIVNTFSNLKNLLLSS